MRVKLILMESNTEVNIENKIELFGSVADIKLSSDRDSVMSQSVCQFNVYDQEIARLREETKFLSEVVQNKQKEIEDLKKTSNDHELSKMKNSSLRAEIETLKISLT